jgi:hypothetical protein
MLLLQGSFASQHTHDEGCEPGYDLEVVQLDAANKPAW